jgi:hypothetical protein
MAFFASAAAARRNASSLRCTSRAKSAVVFARISASATMTPPAQMNSAMARPSPRSSGNRRFIGGMRKSAETNAAAETEKMPGHRPKNRVVNRMVGKNSRKG